MIVELQSPPSAANHLAGFRLYWREALFHLHHARRIERRA